MSDPITLEEIQAIEDRAEAASLGPWTARAEAFDGLFDVRDSAGHYVAYCGGEETARRGENAAHIAGMDPKLTLRLCAALRSLMGYVPRRDPAPPDTRPTCSHGILGACPYCAEAGPAKQLIHLPMKLETNRIP